MTPGHHALGVKIKSIEEEVELKINFASEFRGGCAVPQYRAGTRPHGWSDWKIPMKTPEFKRKDTLEFVCEVAVACDSGVTGDGCVRDAA
jgi:hypothetical protein